MPTDPYPKNKDPKNTDPKNTSYYKRIKAEGIPYGQQSTYYQGKFMTIARMEQLKAQGGRHPGGIKSGTPSVPGVPTTTATTPAGATTVSLMGTPSPAVPLTPPVVGAPVTGTARQTTTTPATVPGSIYDRQVPGQQPYDPNAARQVPGQSPYDPNAARGQAVPGAQTPSWWNPNVYANPNSEQSFANAANAILPTLSPEDQRTMANYLATNFKDVYGNYANATFAPIPTQLTNERSTFLSPDRANAALGMLDRLKQASGGKELGTGYEFLRNAVQLLTKYSNPGSPMTREQYAEFSNALKSMSASMGSDVSAYKNLATLFNMPTFTAGPLVSNTPNTRLTQ